MRPCNAAVRRALAVVVSLCAAMVVVPAIPAAAAACSASTFTVTRVSGPVLYLDLGESPQVSSAYEGFKIENSSGSTYTDVWVKPTGFTAGAKIQLAARENGLLHVGSMAAGAVTHAYFYLTASAPTVGAETHTLGVYAGRPDHVAAAACTTAVSLSAESDIKAAANKVVGVASGPKPPELGGIMTISVSGDTGQIGTIGGHRSFTTGPASFGDWRADAYQLVGSKIVMTGGNNRTDSNVLYLSSLNSTDTHYEAVFTFVAVGATTTPTAISPMSHISSGTQTKHTSIDTTEYQAILPIEPTVNRVSLSATGTPSTLPVGGGGVAYTVTVTNSGTITTTLDDFTIAMPTAPGAATFRSGSATYNGAALADPYISSGTASFVGRFAVPTGASRTLSFILDLPPAGGTYSTSITGHVETTQIDTTTGTTDDAPATVATYVTPPPTLTSLSPTSGTNHGGTTVTITGTRFTGASAVVFGSTAARSFTVVNGSTIIAVAPDGTATVDVRVTTPEATTTTSAASKYTYVTAVNNVPAFTGAVSNTTQTVVVGGAVTALAATDADGDTLTYLVTGGALPTGVSLSSNGAFTGTATTIGSYSATITVSDGFGGSTTTTLSVTVNPPPTITITGGASVATADTTPVVAGATSLPSGTVLNVTVDGAAGGTATVQPDGSWSLTLSGPLAEGDYAVVVNGRDALGNLATDQQVVTVDTTGPVIAIDPPGATKDMTPAITGTTDAPVGSTVTIAVFGQTFTTTVAADGTFSASVPAALTEGHYTVSAVVTDALGNPSSDTGALVVDTTAPVVSVVAPSLTNDRTPTLTGTSDEPVGSIVSLSISGQSFTTIVMTGGTFSVAVPAALADGDYMVTASVVDAAGNTGTDTDDLTVDRTAPQVTVDAPALTRDRTPTLTGTSDRPAGSTGVGVRRRAERHRDGPGGRHVHRVRASRSRRWRLHGDGFGD
jgi:hypothetical protein